MYLIFIICIVLYVVIPPRNLFIYCREAILAGRCGMVVSDDEVRGGASNHATPARGQNGRAMRLAAVGGVKIAPIGRRRDGHALIVLDVLVLVDRNLFVVLILKLCFMPFGPAAAAGIQAGGNMLSNLFNIGSQALTNAANRRQEEKMFNWENNTNITNWAMENEYNSPANVMKRLKEAGLNPALVYGGGASASGGSISSSSAKASGQQAPRVDGLTDFIQTFMQMQMQEKQINLIEAQTHAKEVDAELTRSHVDNSVQDLHQKRMLAPGQLTALDLSNQKQSADIRYTLDENERKAAMQAPNLQKAAEEILNLRLSRARTDAEITHVRQQIENLKQDVRLKNFDEDLQKQGIPRNSPAWWKVLVQALGGEMTDDSAKGLPSWLQRAREKRR